MTRDGRVRAGGFHRCAAAVAVVLALVGVTGPASPAAAFDVPPEEGFFLGGVDEAFGRSTEGATVTIDLGPNGTMQTTANAQGHFDFVVPVPAGGFWAFAYGCDPSGRFCDGDEVYAQVVQGGTLMHGFLLDFNFGSVTGTVRGVDTDPLPGLTVWVVVDGGEPTEVVTDEYGTYVVDAPAGATVEVSTEHCEADVCAADSGSVVVTNGSTEVLDLDLEPFAPPDEGYFWGSVEELHGRPVEGGTVTIDLGANGIRKTTAYSDGGFLFTDPMPAGGYWATAEGCDPSGLFCDTDEAYIEIWNTVYTHHGFVLDFDFGTVTGTVRDTDGDLLADTVVDVTVDDETPAPVMTDDSGAFTVDAPAGSTVEVASRVCDVDGCASDSASVAVVDGSTHVLDLALESEVCAGQAFIDVGASHPFCFEIEWMADAGISTGYDDGTFRPTREVTRMQIAALLYRLVGSPDGADPTCEGDVGPFIDVDVDHTFCGEIAWLASSGIAEGFPDGTFQPSAAVNRMAIAAFMYRIFEPTEGDEPECVGASFVDVGSDHPFCTEIEWMAAHGITTGFDDDTFRPTQVVTRQAVAAQMYRAVATFGLPSAS